MGTQRDRAAAEARTRILAAAADCIVRDGLAQVRMAAIAKSAGVSAGLLHYHFDTKEALFGEVLAYSHGISTELNQRAVDNAGEGPAARLASFLDRCLPSDQRLEREWMLWQELALLCIRDPHLAAAASAAYETLYSTVEAILVDGAASGVFTTALDPRSLAETTLALTDGLGGRLLAKDLDLQTARTRLAATVGLLVGYDGPLPAPKPFTDATLA